MAKEESPVRFSIWLFLARINPLRLLRHMVFLWLQPEIEARMYRNNAFIFETIASEGCPKESAVYLSDKDCAAYSRQAHIARLRASLHVV